jgi:hypothetical protein
MPVQPCTKDGKPGYRWGETGKCYTYPPGSRKARADARMQAEIQGYAVEKSGYQEQDGKQPA